MFSSWDIPKWKLSHCASGFLFNQFFVVLEIITALTPEFLNHIFLNNPSSYHQIVTSTYPNGNFSKHTSLLYTATISIFFFFFQLQFPSLLSYFITFADKACSFCKFRVKSRIVQRISPEKDRLNFCLHVIGPKTSIHPKLQTKDN